RAFRRVRHVPPSRPGHHLSFLAPDREVGMTRTVFRGGKVFDGTGAPLSDADLVIEDARIVDVGPGLDGDEAVECDGKALLPGLFDCHIHLMGRYEDRELEIAHRPFSYAFFMP